MNEVNLPSERINTVLTKKENMKRFAVYRRLLRRLQTEVEFFKFWEQTGAIVLNNISLLIVHT